VLSQGVVLSNRYLLNERVATGGMGEVWWGTDLLLRRKVAVKVLLPSLVSDSEFITRFRTEARMMAALRHPGIVQIYDYGEDAVVNGSRVDYLVMEYIEGAPLSKWIKETGKLGITETMSVVTQAAQALHVAHDAGIVHRDVKPSNLLVQPDGSVVLVDFGVARSADMASITATNIILGSAHYMAPEQASGQPVSAATDIYALGTVAYYCLTGRPPFTGDNLLQVVTQHLQGEPPTLPAEIPAPVAALVTRALAKDPANRFPSAAAFADAARATQSAASAPPPMGAVETPVGSAPSPPGDLLPVVPPTVGGNRRRNATLAGVAGAVVIGLTGLVAMMAFQPEADQSRTPPVTKLPVGASALSPGSGPGVEVTEPATGEPTPSAAMPAKSTASPVTSTPSATAPVTAKPTTTGNPKPTTTRTSTAPSNPYTPAQVCGSGYRVIDSARLTATGGTLRGTVYLLYNAGNGDNCTVTLKATSVGTATAVSTYLEVQGGPRSTNSGSFSYYAGPVRASAAGVCVRWGGSAGGVSYNSGFEHCG
jgi:serine/threonine-protein kinase